MAVILKLTGPPVADAADIKPDASVNLDLDHPWREPLTPRRLLRAGIGSVLFHIAIVILWIVLPSEPWTPLATVSTPDIRQALPLYLPPKTFELTQKDPNQGKISHELDVRSMRPAPEPQAPRFHPPSPPPGPVAAAQPVRLPPIETPKIEAPKIDVPSAMPAVTAAAPAPAPTPPPQEKPKLAFEDVGSSQTHAPSGKSAIPLPKDVVPDPIPKAAPARGGGGTMVGDIGDSSITTPNSMHTPSPGESKSNLQLLSDPKGVDFKPYMIQVLMAVRRNWLSILPESARLGRRGRVVIQFAIDRTGAVPKVVIAEGAGTDALDRAAVAAISASVPLPALPAEYKGDQIRLQLAFSYNMPVR
jgi:TonB family protein